MAALPGLTSISFTKEWTKALVSVSSAGLEELAHLLCEGGDDIGTVQHHPSLCQQRLASSAATSSFSLTLPPASFPWDWSDRRDQVRDRKRWLDMARVTRSRALLRRCVRRVLTFGLWRN